MFHQNIFIKKNTEKPSMGSIKTTIFAFFVTFIFPIRGLLDEK